jgi:hypothetical protein
MNITVQVEPADVAAPPVHYRWDTDTAILTASLGEVSNGHGISGSVELAGSDGSWVILDVRAGRINGVEVAVWPDVRKLPSLLPPDDAPTARVLVPARRAETGVAAMQMDTALVAESDQSERTIHFKLGTARVAARTVKIGRDVLVDVDDRQTIKGIWLLNVPPFPADE